MRISIAADHGGYEMKERLKEALTRDGHQVEDFGACGLDLGDDYPDFVIPMAEAVASGKAERGIALCTSGVGASIAANKIPGVRAALIHETFSARQGVEDDDMNVLCLGSKVLSSDGALELARLFLEARFSGAERHRRRLGKVADMEKALKGDRP
jgi:ribose 5-phosphate isomerase B